MPRRRAGGKRVRPQVQLSAATHAFLEACAAAKVAEKKMNNLHAIQAEWLRKNDKWMDKNDDLSNGAESSLLKYTKTMLRRHEVWEKAYAAYQAACSDYMQLCVDRRARMIARFCA